MGTFLTLIVIFLILWIFWRTIGRRLMMRYMQHKVEDITRSAFGMPPRPGSRKEKKQKKSGNENRKGNSYRGYGFRRAATQPIIPREYAEDVEFVEIKEYSQTNIAMDADGDVKVEQYNESQITDVEWEEIKK